MSHPSRVPCSARARCSTLWAIGASLVITGCAHEGASSRAPETLAPRASGQGEQPWRPSNATIPELSDEVRALAPSCAPTRKESCNGLDDNCNGVIDEGCGYSTGAIQITAAWQSGADLDLYVTDPAGETISYTHPLSASGGHLDHDARGACRPAVSAASIENAYWPGPRPLPGRYEVTLHYWGECGSSAGPTEVTVSLSMGSKLVGSYAYTLSPNQRIKILAFLVP